MLNADDPEAGINIHVPIPEPTYGVHGRYITVYWGVWECSDELDGRDPEVQALDIACSMAKDVFAEDENDGHVGAFEKFKQSRFQGQDGPLLVDS